MAVETTHISDSYAPNGVTTTFPVTFSSAGVDEIEVTIDGDVVDTGNYVFEREADGLGDVVFTTAPTGTALIISSKPSFAQETVFTRLGPSTNDLLNEPLDDAARRDQYLLGLIVVLQTLYASVLALATSASLAVSSAVATATSAAAAAAQAVIDAAVFVVTSATGDAVSTRSMLAGIVSPVIGQTAYLTEAGRQGWFECISSVGMPTDTYEGIYVLSTADGTKAWRRIVEEDDHWQARWFGFSTANLATNHLRLRAIEALKPEGGAVRLPSGDFSGFAPGLTASNPALAIFKSGRWYGSGYNTHITPADAVCLSHLFAVNCSDVEIDHMRFSGMQTVDNADSQFPISVGARHNNGVTNVTKELTDRIYLHDLTFQDCDSCIRVIRSVWSGPTNFSPTSVVIERIIATDVGYQAISIWSDQLDLHSFDISSKAGISIRSAHYIMRLVSCRKLRVSNGVIQDPLGVTAIAVMRGETGSLGNAYAGGVSDPEDVTISNVQMHGIGAAFNHLEIAGSHIIANCSYRGPTSATGVGGAHFTFGSHTSPMRNGHLQVIGGIYTGTSAAIYFANSNYKRIDFDSVKFVGNNSATGGFLGVVQVDTAGTDGLGNAIEGVKMLNLNNCSFLFKDSNFTFGVAIAGASAGSRFSARNCVFPFGVSGANDISQVSGSAATVDGAGTNRAFLAGDWLEQTTDFSTNPRGTSY
jgi:hypothetical protein